VLTPLLLAVAALLWGSGACGAWQTTDTRVRALQFKAGPL
jgi:hypothetical protein